jgi:WD40 repeat protein
MEVNLAVLKSLIQNLTVLLFFYISSAEAITALEFSSTGEYLATGDRNGRITVLKQDFDSKTNVRFRTFTNIYNKCTMDLLEKARLLASLFSISIT